MEINVHLPTMWAFCADLESRLETLRRQSHSKVLRTKAGRCASIQRMATEMKFSEQDGRGFVSEVI